MSLPPDSLDMTPFADFAAASRSALDFLYERLGFNLWMMTRTEGNDWIVLQASDHGYGVAAGTVFSWTDSFCSRMVRGEGPMVAPNVAEVDIYCRAPIAQQVNIGAYIGVPVMRDDGTLFGTLCAIDPQPQRESIRDELPLVELLGRLLGSVLSAELKALEQARQSQQNRLEALTDALTGLPNRRGWDQAVAAEETRLQRFGSPACVLIIDLDDLKVVNDTEGHDQGDKLIRRAAQALRSAVRDSDVVARLGGDEFGVIASECNSTNADQLVARVARALTANRVRASVGMARRDHRTGLAAAIVEADRRMYAQKSQRPDEASSQ